MPQAFAHASSAAAVFAAQGLAGLPFPDPETTTLSMRFAQVVEAMPGRAALTSGGRSWTYAELGHAAARIAGRIHKASAPSERDHVGLLLDQGLDFVAGVFGALSTGRAFVALDPTYPAERLTAMREDAGLARVVCTADRLDLARALGFARKQIVVMDRGGIDAHARYLPGPATPRDPAWILFTSGSTGRPKGVTQTHRVGIHNYGRHLRGFALSPDDRQSLVYPTSVYGGLRDILNATLTGATLCHYPLREAGYAGLPDWLEQQRCTIYCSVASVFRRFTATLDETTRFEHVRLIKLGGETVHPQDLRQFQRLFTPACVLFTGLGSTETGMALRHAIRADDPIDPASVPLGRAVEGVEVELLDDARKPVAAGQIGEIAIRSRYLTEGYFGRDDLTAQVITRDPDDADLKTYHTGDLGQFGDDGLLYHRGRKDAQVKVRGNRVELTEVESALRAMSLVSDAAVRAVVDTAGDTKLEAYLVLKVGEADWPCVSAMRDELQKHVPRFAVPGVFRVVDAMPVTPNGKLDRKALGDTPSRRLRITGEPSPPCGEMEQRLAALFAETLGEAVEDADAGFFDLGGDSLKAVDLLLRIERAFGAVLSLEGLLRDASVRALSARLGWGDALPDDPVVVPLRTAGSGPPLFVLSGRGGAVACYAKLLPHLPAEVSVYGLQLPGVALGTEPMDDAEALAGVLCTAIEEVAPTGVIRVLGYSFGGLLAFEIARQFERRGRRPQWVGVIDHHVPGSRQRLALPQRLALRARLLAEQGWAERRQWAVDRGRRLMRRSTDKPDLVPPGQEALLQRLRRVNEASVRAARGYRYGRYGGSVEVFACRQKHDYERFFRCATDRGWTTFADVRGVRRIDGRHLDVFEPANVASLGEAVTAALRSLADPAGPPVASSIDRAAWARMTVCARRRDR